MKFKNVTKVFTTAAVCGVLAFALAGCGASGSSSSSTTASDDKTIKVGASPSPHSEILAQVSDTLAEEGYTLQVVEYSDYVQPNVALEQGELDANYFQHLPYLNDYNDENNTNLVSAGAIHYEPMTLYAGKTAALADIADGATIAVPSDATNEGRALNLLAAQGVITLKDGVGLAATKADIVSNPHNVNIVEAEAAALPRQLEDCDFAVINGNYALSSGIDQSKAIASETSDSEAAKTYANIIAVKADNASSEKTTALVNALQSEKVKSYITSTYNGVVVAQF